MDITPRTARRNDTFDATLAGLVSPAPGKRRDVHPRYTTNWRAVATLLYVAILCLLLGIGIGASLVMSAITKASEPVGLPPCATEDSVGCYWDADTMGNRQGDDVVDVPQCTDAIADAGGVCIGEPRG